MKRYLFFLALAVAACAKTPGSQEISIRLTGVETCSLTKVDPSSALSASLPKRIPPITLQSTSVPERRYTVTNGETVVVPIDTYQVSGIYEPAEDGAIRGGKVYSTPTFVVSGTIQVVEGQSNYYVPASYTCFALVMGEDVESYKTHNTAGSMFAIPWMVGDDVKVCYISGGWSFPALPIVAVPKDRANYEETTFGLVTDKSYEGVFIEYGKWYSFSPGGVVTNQGNIGIDFPSWECGL